MKSLFKKIMLSALYVLLGTSFAFSQDIKIDDVELVRLPSKMPLSDKTFDLTGLKVNIYYSDGNVGTDGYADGNTNWTFTPDDITPGDIVPKNTTFVVSYKNFPLPSFNSDWSADYHIQGFPKNTAHFYSNGVEVSSSEARENYKIVFPKEDPAVAGLTFCGWSATEITSVQSSAPDMVDKSNVIMGANDVNYYAVFAITNEYTDNYTMTINSSNCTATSIKAYCDQNPSITKDVAMVSSNVSNMSFSSNGLSSRRGYIYNKESLNLTSVTIQNGSNLATYYGTNENPSSGNTLGTNKYFSVRCNSINNNGTATSITVKFSANREETFYVTTQPQINFVATDETSYYATFSCPEKVVISSANVEAYYVTVDKDGKLNLNEAGEKIDGKLHLLENTGYLLKINQGGQIDYNFEMIAYGSSSEPNMLVPCPATAVFKPEADGNYYYKLAYGNNTKKSNLGFWWGKEDGSGNFKVKAGGALLRVPQSQAASLMRGLAFEQISGNETGLEEEMIIEDCSPAIYNLSGQRVNSVNKSGLYIVNGKTRWVNVK